MDRPTFSQAWSRVSRLTPTLRPQVQIHRQLFRGEPWHVVHDPVSNNFFRLNPVAYHFVGLLDGHRSVDDAWRLTLERFGDAAPTQNEVIGLLGQLNQSNLLRVDLPADAAPLLDRQRSRTLRQWGGQLMSILSLRIPLFNPDKALEWLLPFFRPALSKFGFIAWIAWLVFCLWQFLPHVRHFSTDWGSILAPSNWAWMIVLFIVTKAWHELGHGLVCKRLGGVVPEVGVMLLVLFPAPYVDATSSWNFPDKWKRLLVAAAGMIFELALAGVAALVWIHSDDNTLARQLARNMVFLASVTTILFNANPLLRFDGYYMLSDFLEIPNLYERSGRHLRWIFQRYLFGLRNAQPASTLFGERAFMGIYGVFSQIYRAMVMFGISLVIAQRIPVLGIIVGVWSLCAWAIFPTGKFLHWLVTSPALTDHRVRAVGSTVALASVVFVVVGVIPMPDHRRAEGIVESIDKSDIAMQADGFVKKVYVDAGTRVRAGDIILVAENKEQESRRLELLAQLKRLEAIEAQTLMTDPVARKINAARMADVRANIRVLDERLEKLTLRAPETPAEGIVVGNILTQLEGRFLRKGQVIGQIINPEALRVTAMVDQPHNATPFFGTVKSVELRTAGNIETALPSKLLWFSESGRTTLPHPALGYPAGGSVPTKPDDNKGLTALRPQFELWLELPVEAARSGVMPYPGQRVHVRFTLSTYKPWLFQWIHHLRQVVRDQLLI